LLEPGFLGPTCPDPPVAESTVAVSRVSPALRLPVRRRFSGKTGQAALPKGRCVSAHGAPVVASSERARSAVSVCSLAFKCCRPFLLLPAIFTYEPDHGSGMVLISRFWLAWERRWR
jgi:hypothetical protein